MNSSVRSIHLKETDISSCDRKTTNFRPMKVEELSQISVDVTPLTPSSKGLSVGQLDSIRSLVENAIKKRQFESAVFFAEKIVHFGGHCPGDVMQLGNALFLHGEYNRAIHWISKRKGNNETKIVRLKFQLLLAQCLAASKQWEECLDSLEQWLGDDEAELLKQAKDVSYSAEKEINVVAALCTLRARAYEAVEDRENAIEWYQYAVICDVNCSEALFYLVDNHLLTNEQEELLMGKLTFTSENIFLQEMYKCHFENYKGTEKAMNQKFNTLDVKYGLKESSDVLLAKGHAYYNQHDTEKSYEISKRICTQDPYQRNYVPLYISSMVELRKSSELFSFAHNMVDSFPNKAISWYAVGCYYLVVSKFDTAQRYFHKSTTMNPRFAPAWVGFGHSFAAQDESDQAMASYRSASRLYVGSHLPGLYIGMEYLRTNNLSLGMQYIGQAVKVCPVDPLVRNELGIIYFKQKRYGDAASEFHFALELCRNYPKKMLEIWEPTIFNLGHAYRKQGEFEKAKFYYKIALSLSPDMATTHSALGFLFHLLGDNKSAIESYHKALSFKPEDTLSADLLSRALKRKFETWSSKIFKVESLVTTDNANTIATLSHIQTVSSLSNNQPDISWNSTMNSSTNDMSL